MRNTRENVIKLLTVLIESYWKSAHDEKMDQSARDYEKYTAMAYQSVLWLLKDQNYFNKIYEIYKDSLE